MTILSLFLLVFLWLMPIVSIRWSWPASSPFDLIMLGWGIVLMLAVLVTADPDLTLPKATGVILGLAVWRFSNRVVRSKTMLFWFMAVYSFLGVGFIILGSLSANWIVKVPFLSDLIVQFPQAQIILPEASRQGVHTNQLAGTLLFYVPFFTSVMLGFVLLRPSRMLFLLYLFLFISTLALLLLTQSRTGWIAAAGSMFCLTLMWWYTVKENRRLRRVLGVTTMVMAGIGISLLLFIGPARLQAVWEDPNQESLIGNLGTIAFRQEVWTWTLSAISDFPFTGIGLGSFQAVIRRFYPVNVAPGFDIAHAHNLYLQIAVDTGVPGFIFYLALIGLIFFAGLQVARKSIGLRPYVLGLLGSLAAFHIFGLFDTLALGSKPHLIFWVIFSLITAMHRLQQTRLQDNEAVLSLDQS